MTRLSVVLKGNVSDPLTYSFDSVRKLLDCDARIFVAFRPAILFRNVLNHSYEYLTFLLTLPGRKRSFSFPPVF